MRGKVILNPKKIENNIRIMAPKMDEERGTQGKKRRRSSRWGRHRPRNPDAVLVVYIIGKSNMSLGTNLQNHAFLVLRFGRRPGIEDSAMRGLVPPFQ